MKKLFGTPSLTTNRLIRRITSLKFIVTFAVLMVVALFGAWQYHNTTNPDRLFWGMVDNSLQTTSFSRHSVTKSGGQSADQVVDVSVAPKQTIYSQTRFNQTGADEAQAATENIGTPKADYVRYTSITTSQRNAQGKQYDFSKVINVWGGSQTEDQKLTNGQLFNQSVLGVVPTGNLTSTQRNHLIALMKNKGTYTYKVSKPSREMPFGRPTYTFNVVVSPPAYIGALKEFGRDIGLNQLESVNPDHYKDATKMQFMVSVDGWTHQITHIVQGSGNKDEAITGYNFRKTMPTPPTKTIGVDELQARLQTIE